MHASWQEARLRQAMDDVVDLGMIAYDEACSTATISLRALVSRDHSLLGARAFDQHGVVLVRLYLDGGN